MRRVRWWLHPATPTTPSSLLKSRLTSLACQLCTASRTSPLCACLRFGRIPRLRRPRTRPQRGAAYPRASLRFQARLPGACHRRPLRRRRDRASSRHRAARRWPRGPKTFGRAPAPTFSRRPAPRRHSGPAGRLRPAWPTARRAVPRLDALSRVQRWSYDPSRFHRTAPRRGGAASARSPPRSCSPACSWSSSSSATAALMSAAPRPELELAADLELGAVCTTSPRTSSLGAVCTTSPPIAATVVLAPGRARARRPPPDVAAPRPELAADLELGAVCTTSPRTSSSARSAPPRRRSPPRSCSPACSWSSSSSATAALMSAAAWREH